MKNILKAAAAVILIMTLAVPAFAAQGIVKPNDDFYYLDTANVLSKETEGEIFFCNQLLYDACGAQIVVAALDTINGADTYDYAYDMFKEWGIGSSRENNGFLLLMAIAEDDYYALPGYGIDGVFSASEIKKLYDKYLEKDFAAKNYDAGAKKFFEAVFEKIADRYNAGVTVRQGIDNYNAYIANGLTDMVGASNHGGGGGAESAEFGWHEPSSQWSVNPLLVIIVILLLIRLFSRRRGGSMFWPIFTIVNSSRRRNGYYGDRTRYTNHSSTSFHGGNSFRGGNSFHGGGFSGGFGGARGGGGGSFGGGAGRGRH